MPGGDGTGPGGLGPMTGRAAGLCAGYSAPGYMNPIAGRGYWGRGRGFGRGFGRGRGWGRGYSAYGGYPYAGAGYGAPYAGAPYAGAPYAGAGYPYAPEMAPKEEATMLKDEAKAIQDELKNINARIAELESAEKKK